MTPTASEAEREVEASRTNLDRTVEALKEKMTPGQLFDEAARVMGGGGRQIASKFMEQAKANPMPLAVMGLGLAWLMTSSNTAARGYAEPRSFSAAAGGSGRQAGMGGGLQKAGEAAAGMMAEARERLGESAQSLSERGHAAADALGELPGQAREMLGVYGDRAQRTFAQVLEREPLLLGAVGLLVGAAVGAALPHTDLEDQTVGPLRDRLVDRGKDLAEQGAQQVGEAARAAYAGVKDELAQSPPDADPADRAEAAVRAGAAALRGPSPSE